MSGVEVLEPNSRLLTNSGKIPVGSRILGVEICGTSPVSGVEVLEPNSGLLTNCGKIPVGSTNVAVEHLPCLGSKSLS